MSLGYVLVVEDEPLVLRANLRWLTSLGYEAHGVRHAEAALVSIQERMPSVVLADFILPLNDGLWLLTQVRARWPTLPVVMATAALLSESAIIEAKEQGAVAFLGKPFTREALHQALQRGIERMGL